jgi:flagellar capping protein FliD
MDPISTAAFTAADLALPALYRQPGSSRPVKADTLPSVLRPISPDNPLNVDFYVPNGESGARISSASELTSQHDLLLIERSHLPAQRRQAASDGAQVISQEVSIRTAIAPGGRFIAVAGQAETNARTPAGDTMEMRELAFSGDLRALFIANGSAFLDPAVSGRPQLVTRTGSAADGLQIEHDRETLLGAGSSGPISFLLRLDGRMTQSVFHGFAEIRRTLGALRDVIDPLLSPQSLSSRAASSSDGAVAAAAGASAQIGRSVIHVTQLAQAQRVASDQGISESPGLSGTFSLNGVRVAVAASDTVYDMVRIINRGVDIHGDGEYSGGSAESRVRASFVDGRLRLESLDQGVQGIQAADPNNVLAALGVVQTAGGQLDFKNVLTEGRGSEFSIDGVAFARDSNTVADAAAGLTLTLNGVGEAAVTVADDPAPAVGRMKSFLASFNEAIDALNAQLIRGLSAGDAASAGVALKDAAVQGVRVRLQRDVTDAVPGQPEAVGSARDAGLTAAVPARFTFYQDTLASAVRSLRVDMAPLRNAGTVPTVFNALDEIGITQRTDGTIALDEAKFAEVLAAHPADVQDLFTRAADGILQRVHSTIEQTLDPDIGILAMREQALNAIDARLRKTLSEAFQNTGQELPRLIGIA